MTVLDHQGYPLTSRRTRPQTHDTERKNSKHSGIRTRQTCGFFVPDDFASGGVRGYNRRKPKAARRLCSVLNLPTSSGRRVRTFPRCHAPRTGDVMMRSTPPARHARYLLSAHIFEASQRPRHQCCSSGHEVELAVALIVGALTASVAWSFVVAGVTP